MTGYMLKKRLRASVTRINDRLFVSAEHPADDVGCHIQSELSEINQKDTGRKYHNFTVAPEEIEPLYRAMKKAARHAASMKRKYEADIERAEANRLARKLRGAR